MEEHIGAFRGVGLQAIELGWVARPETRDLEAYLAGADWGRFLIHNYFPQPEQPFVLNLASQDPSLLGKSRSLSKRALHLSALLSAPYYSVHAGFRAEFSAQSLGKRLEHRRVASYECASRTFRESIVALAETARSVGVQLLIEPNVVEVRNLVGGQNELLLLAEAEEIASFMEGLACPEVGILLDTGHLNVSSSTLGFSREDYVEQLQRWIRGFHVHDNDGTMDQHRPPAADSWVFDVLNHPTLRRWPVVLEATFPDVSTLAAYYRWFAERLQA
jgi:sugar phosphate isomerase/epimerase